jgi:hypothetical protein
MASGETGRWSLIRSVSVQRLPLQKFQVEEALPPGLGPSLPLVLGTSAALVVEMLKEQGREDSV